MDIKSLPRFKNITNTIDIIDVLEEQKYENKNGIILEAFSKISYGKDNYILSLILCRVNRTDDMYKSRMTFTKLKELIQNRIVSPCDELVLVDVLYGALDYAYKNNKLKDHSCWIFPKPVELHAQSSLNRQGYGNVTINGEIVHQGTLYGETTVYGIKGAIFDKVKKQ